MNRKPTRTPADPWEWFSGSIYHLGKSTVIKIWNVSEKTIERWSANRLTTQSISNNPLSLLAGMLEKLMEKGKFEFARSAVDFLANTVGCQLSCIEDVTPDKETLSEELLDDLPAVSDFHQAIIENQPETSVREKYRKAKRELDEDYQAYLEHKNQ